MFRLSTLLTSILLISPLPSVFCGNLPTVLQPFTLTPSVEIFQSPVSKVETISLTPRITKAVSPGGSAVAIASSGVSTVPVVQRIESYTTGDSSNSEIRDLLRSLLSELRSSKPVTTFSPSDSYGAPPARLSDSYGAPSPARLSDSYGAPSPARLSDSYGAPPPSQPTDSYGAPPRNTFTDASSPSYPDSRSKPEKILVQERQPAAFISAPTASAVAQVQSAPVAVQEVVRTVYQPVYVPVQYAAAAPQTEYVSVSQPVTQAVAVPTRINTGVSAVAISTIHSSPAYAIQQQQLSVPVVQQQVQQVATLLSDGSGGWSGESSNGGYQK